MKIQDYCETKKYDCSDCEINKNHESGNCEKLFDAYTLGYSKAIDDFLSKAKEKKYHSHITYENCVSIAELDWLAKELKEGTNNGTDNQ